MKIKPLGDRVLIEPAKKEEKSAGGILLPETADKKPEWGKVLEVGPGRWEEGKLVPLSVKKGDEVLFAEYGPTKIKVNNKEYLIAREEDILAILE